MKQTFITKVFNYILAILGFATTASCDHNDYVDQTLVMYGAPTMDFQVSGKVVDQKSAPIAGIKVSSNSSLKPASTVVTAEDGTFTISGRAATPLLGFEDIDGPENGGEFADKTQKIEVTQTEKGDGGWYLGKYEAKNVVIEMEEKQ